MRFRFLHEIYSVLKKNEPDRSIICGIIDSERWPYLNASQGLFLKTFRKSMCYLGPKTPEISRQVILPNFFIIRIQVELAKAIFNQI